MYACVCVCVCVSTQVESSELRQDNRAAYELINHLKEQLAEMRLAQQQQQKQQQQQGQASGADDKEAILFPHQGTLPSNQASSVSDILCICVMSLFCGWLALAEFTDFMGCRW